ncbi:DUF402 domain-containing protein [Actinoplanes couchii]|uniref:DUF402 domain-containing protein n=1 Tax=Actinoplanes couchii TaxID=403638 RepID=A0ABQ3X3P0_9ACTN|nr:DUF402 domain-containing protein [Actinoplanes couchii]MDR6322848.1 protein associated with RNAse G/E [Actinoplanes couchii]GID53087.1 hypothetical protein Aco03nite_014910 [Actinoplanes couchii]
MPELDLVLTKYDGTPHRSIRTLLLGTDEFGTWLGTPRGSVINFHYGPTRTRTTTQDAVRVIAHDAWWMAMFLPAPDPTEIYCDVITPAVRSRTAITVIDLDLDVVRRRPNNHVEIEDEDEFAENTGKYAYPEEVITAATTTAATLQKALTTPAAPFNGHHQKWLTHLTSINK